jgi:hypothetical protein
MKASRVNMAQLDGAIAPGEVCTTIFCCTVAFSTNENVRLAVGGGVVSRINEKCERLSSTKAIRSVRKMWSDATKDIEDIST